MTRPRTSPIGSCSSISPIARLQQRNTPRRLTAMIASQSSSVVSSSDFDAASGDRRVVHHHVEPAEPLDRAGDEPVDVVPARDVGVDPDAEPPPPLDTVSVGSPPSRGSRRTSDDDHVRAFLGQPDRDRAPEPRGRAGDDRNPAVQACAGDGSAPFCVGVASGRPGRPPTGASRRPAVSLRSRSRRRPPAEMVDRESAAVAGGR